MNYVVAGTHPWNRRIFDTTLSRYQGQWIYVSTQNELEQVYDIEPQYIFFLHWSNIVPTDIVENFECVCFHPSHLPYGRGGTPIQNLITRGFEETKLTAFRMTEEIDAGPVYSQETLSLQGPLHQIFAREMILAARMIKWLIKNEPTPTPQEGEPVLFNRRKPEDSALNASYLPYDFIRMLDAEGYPKAFLDYGNWRYEFSDAELVGDTVEAKVIIRKL